MIHDGSLNFPHDITPCWGKLTSHHPGFKASGAWFKGARRRSKVQMLMDRLGLRRKVGNFASGVNHWTMGNPAFSTGWWF